MHERIPVAVDGSRTSEAALGEALDLAGRGAQLRAMDVVDSPYKYPDAQRWGADLIVVGTHGQPGLDWLLLGSVPEGVARTAPVSVPLVRGGTR